MREEGECVREEGECVREEGECVRVEGEGVRGGGGGRGCEASYRPAIRVLYSCFYNLPPWYQNPSYTPEGCKHLEGLVSGKLSTFTNYYSQRYVAKGQYGTQDRSMTEG